MILPFSTSTVDSRYIKCFKELISIRYRKTVKILRVRLLLLAEPLQRESSVISQSKNSFKGGGGGGGKGQQGGGRVLLVIKAEVVAVGVVSSKYP